MHKPLLSALAAGLSLLTLTAGAFAQDAPKDMLELKLATGEVDINPTANSILKLADRLGFYEKHGVKVTILELDGTPQSVAALTSGAVDLADIGIDAAIRLEADNGIKLKGITSGGFGAAFLIAAKSEIKTLGDLAGHSYAISDTGSLDHNLTMAVLRASGIPVDAPNYVAIGAPAARVQALAAGQVDATTVSYGTYLSIADTPGISVLVSATDFADKAPGLSKFVSALDTTIASKPEALKRFVAALIDISRTFDEHPDQWVDAVAAARDDLKKEDLAKTVNSIKGRWCVNGCLNPGEVDKAIDFAYANPEFADIPRIPATDLVDQSFVTQALESLGGIDADPGQDKR
jgi:NitT/TauT family transport system substrate-binding protein